MKKLLLLLLLFIGLINSSFAIPNNAYILGNTWYCDAGYKQSGNKCVALNVPSNAYVLGNTWYCDAGYKQSGNKCVALNITKSNLNTIVDNNQKIKIVSLEKQSSYKDTNLSDALKAIENGESHKIWLSLASEGVDNAQLILGVLYVKGLGVIKSMEDAANWIGLARQNGSMEVSEKAEEVWNEYELWKYE